MSGPATGGSAFPVTAGPYHPNGELVNWPEAGMTLRDWFASQAMQAIITGASAANVKPPLARADIVRNAYIYADAMLAERAK